MKIENTVVFLILDPVTPLIMAVLFVLQIFYLPLIFLADLATYTKNCPGTTILHYVHPFTVHIKLILPTFHSGDGWSIDLAIIFFSNPASMCYKLSNGCCQLDNLPLRQWRLVGFAGAIWRWCADQIESQSEWGVSEGGCAPWEVEKFWKIQSKWHDLLHTFK